MSKRYKITEGGLGYLGEGLKFLIALKNVDLIFYKYNKEYKIYNLLFKDARRLLIGD